MDTDLPCLCTGSLAVGAVALGTGHGFPLGGRRLEPCSRTLPMAATPQQPASPAVGAWHKHTARLDPNVPQLYC